MQRYGARDALTRRQRGSFVRRVFECKNIFPIALHVDERPFGAGPQIGYIIPMRDHLQGYLNLKGYKQFGAQHRPEGWNTWLTFAISPAANGGTTMKPRAFGK